MNRIQILLDELSNLNNNWTIKIEYKYMKYLDGNFTPNLVVMFGTYDIDDHWCSGFISKSTGKMLLEYELEKIDENIWYECFEGGFEDDLENCLARMIENIKKYKKGN